MSTICTNEYTNITIGNLHYGCKLIEQSSFLGIEQQYWAFILILMILIPVWIIGIKTHG